MKKYPIFECEICKRKSTGMRCIMFYFEKEVFGEAHTGIFHSYPVGRHILGCVECNMCYLSQYCDMKHKGIDDWINWILKVEKLK